MGKVGRGMGEGGEGMCGKKTTSSIAGLGKKDTGKEIDVFKAARTQHVHGG